MIVDTGPWIFGKKVMLPAGVIARINSENEVVHVNRTKEEIKNVPEFDEGRYQEQSYREELGGYYGPGGRGYREWVSLVLSHPHADTRLETLDPRRFLARALQQATPSRVSPRSAGRTTQALQW